MTGYTTIKNDKYYVVINTYINGKRKPKWISTGLDSKGNKKKAEQFLREKLREYELQENIITTDILFCDYILVWLENKKISIDITTYNTYKWISENHIIPYFKDKGIKLSKLQRKDIQDFINYKCESGRIDNKKGGLSPKSVKEQKNIINLVCKYAYINNLIASNPCEYVNLPSAEKRQPSFYTQEQIVKLLESIKGESLYPLIYITVAYGLRRSEALGLKWSNIDFDSKIVSIKSTQVSCYGLIQKDKTKNESSRRDYPMPEIIEKLLVDLKKQELENTMLFGKEYNKNDYVFKWDDGKPYQPDYVTSKFRKILKKYNFPHIRFHDLRHTCASLLINEGMQLKDVSDWLGHSSIQTTANIYGHIDKERKQNISNSMVSILDR